MIKWLVSLGCLIRVARNIDKLALKVMEQSNFREHGLSRIHMISVSVVLKSSVINYKHNLEQKGGEVNPAHVAAGFQASVVEVLTKRH